MQTDPVSTHGGENSKPLLFLAPMEGVTDWVMRDILTALGGIDICVTEFLRITDRLMPDHIFHKNCPELLTNSRTRSGTTVFVQLLGGQAGPLAENAARLAELGALGIDLNFGCPAPTVNRHDGGATLLKFTNRLHDIVKTVRAAVPKETPVTAKMRLGFDDPTVCIENALAIQEAGAKWLTIHCRTKTDGYKPPAYWEWIPRLQEKVKIPIITNGEIWTVDDFKKCYDQTKTYGYMMGRGAVRDPLLFKKIRENLSASALTSAPTAKVHDIHQTIFNFYQLAETTVSPHFATARTKGWLKQLIPLSEENKTYFDQIKIETNPALFKAHLQNKLSPDQFHL